MSSPPGRRSKRRSGSQPLFEEKHGRAFCAKNRLCVECGKPLTGRRQRWCSEDCVLAYRVRAEPSYARFLVEQRDHGVCAVCRRDCVLIERQVRLRDLAVVADWWAREGRAKRIAMDERSGTAARYGRSYAASFLERPPTVDVRQGYLSSWSWVDREVGVLLEAARRELLAPLDGMDRWWWRKTFWDADHVVAVASGGGECDLSNYQTLCLPCHSFRTISQAKERAKDGRKARVEPAEGRADGEAGPRGSLSVEGRRGGDDHEAPTGAALGPAREVRSLRRARDGSPPPGRGHGEQRPVEPRDPLSSVSHGGRRAAGEVPGHGARAETEEAPGSLLELSEVEEAAPPRKVRSVQRVPAQERSRAPDVARKRKPATPLGPVGS